jgi:uncharacterized protein (TIGR00251 family)
LPPAFFETLPSGLRLFVRLTPKARAERIEGTILDGEGRTRLKVAVTAPPEDGKANAALIAFLAKRLKIAKSQFELDAGATSRQKTLLIAGEPEELAQRLLALAN